MRDRGREFVDLAPKRIVVDRVDRFLQMRGGKKPYDRMPGTRSTWKRVPAGILCASRKRRNTA
jgi:hypothetical protein